MLEAGRTCDELEPVAQFEIDQPDGWKQLEELQVVDSLEQDDKVYRDEITGLELPPELVRAARSEELDFAARLGIWERGHTVSECLEQTGKPPVPQRFEDLKLPLHGGGPSREWGCDCRVHSGTARTCAGAF